MLNRNRHLTLERLMRLAGGGGLSPAAEDAARGHLADCAACRARWDEVTTLKRELHEAIAAGVITRRSVATAAWQDLDAIHARLTTVQRAAVRAAGRPLPAHEQADVAREHQALVRELDALATTLARVVALPSRWRTSRPSKTCWTRHSGSTGRRTRRTRRPYAPRSGRSGGCWTAPTMARPRSGSHDRDAAAGARAILGRYGLDFGAPRTEEPRPI